MQSALEFEDVWSEIVASRTNTDCVQPMFVSAWHFHGRGLEWRYLNTCNGLSVLVGDSHRSFS